MTVFFDGPLLAHWCTFGCGLSAPSGSRGSPIPKALDWPRIGTTRYGSLGGVTGMPFGAIRRLTKHFSSKAARFHSGASPSGSRGVRMARTVQPLRPRLIVNPEGERGTAS